MISIIVTQTYMAIMNILYRVSRELNCKQVKFRIHILQTVQYRFTL